MQRFNLTELNSGTGVPEIVGEGCQFRDGRLAVDWYGGIYRGASSFLVVTDLTSMHPNLTMVMIDEA